MPIGTGGAKSMLGSEKKFVFLLKAKINHKVVIFHCIINQEALCVQMFPNELGQIKDLVI